MDQITGIQRAIDYAEAHLTEEPDYEAIARQCGYSACHFRWVFGVLCGYTLTEYIRGRRLSLAGEELAEGNVRVIDVALKYGYENPDSFTRAFARFHGVTPSQARRAGAKLRNFPRLSVKVTPEEDAGDAGRSPGRKGETTLECRIEEKPELVLTGYKRRFTGVPFAEEEQAGQEADFHMHTRANQMLLKYMSADRTMTVSYGVIDNADEEGYDYYIAGQLTDWYHQHLSEDIVLGEEAGRFEDIVIPARTYAVFETERCKYPTMKHIGLRRRIAGEWLPASGYVLADAPEVIVTHWYRKPDVDKRYIELWVPVKKK